MSPRSTCASAFPARTARRNSRAAASSGSTANVLAAPSRRSMCAALLAALSDPDSANAANVASALHGSGGRRGGFRSRPRRIPAPSSASVDPSGSAESSDASFSLTPSPSPASPKSPISPVPSRTSTARSCVSAHPSRSSRNVQNNRAASAQSRVVPAPSRYADASACGARQCPASLASWNSSNARVRFLSAPTPDWCNAPRLNAASGSPAAAPAANASRAAAASRGVPHPL